MCCERLLVSLHKGLSWAPFLYPEARSLDWRDFYHLRNNPLQKSRGWLSELEAFCTVPCDIPLRSRDTQLLVILLTDILYSTVDPCFTDRLRQPLMNMLDKPMPSIQYLSPAPPFHHPACASQGPPGTVRTAAGVALLPSTAARSDSHWASHGLRVSGSPSNLSTLMA